MLTGFGFSEVYNYSLTAKPSIDDEDFIELENPVSDEFRYTRPLLLFGVLKNIASNKRYFDSINAFEFGKVFYMDRGKFEEVEDLALFVNESDGFYLVKGYVDEFLKSVGVTNFYYDPMEDNDTHAPFLHAGRRVNIMLDDESIGFLGEVDSKIASYYGSKSRSVVAELDFGKLVAAAEEEQIYQKPSRYPEVVRDISLLVPRETMVEEVLNVIETAGGELLRDTDLFDMFEGENIPEGMKNLAFHLLFQSDERTLKSEEVDEIMKKIYAAIAEKGWEVR